MKTAAFAFAFALAVAAALAAYEVTCRAGGIRIARWQVANVLRSVGRTDEAPAMQLALERELVAAGANDPYGREEPALLHAARGGATKAA